MMKNMPGIKLFINLALFSLLNQSDALRASKSRDQASKFGTEETIVASPIPDSTPKHRIKK